MTFEVLADSGERRRFDNSEAAIEYINCRPHENFIIINASNEIFQEIRKRVRNTIRRK